MSFRERLDQVRWFFQRKYRFAFFTVMIYAALC